VISANWNIKYTKIYPEIKVRIWECGDLIIWDQSKKTVEQMLILPELIMMTYPQKNKFTCPIPKGWQIDFFFSTWGRGKVFATKVAKCE
jgi:hypothetical protein